MHIVNVDSNKTVCTSAFITPLTLVTHNTTCKLFTDTSAELYNMARRDNLVRNWWSTLDAISTRSKTVPPPPFYGGPLGIGNRSHGRYLV